MEKANGPWTLPEDLAKLHNVTIAFGVQVNKAAEQKHQKTGAGPLSFMSLSNLHRAAISNHRAVRAICEAGWTPTAPIVIRTLLDLLVSTYATASDPERSEYMGFKYLCHSLIEGLFSQDSSAEDVKNNAKEIDKIKAKLTPEDVKRADELIASYKVKVSPYWYSPEFSSPGTVIHQKIPNLLYVWKKFSGSTHGSFVGSVMFNDHPDDAGIDPEENPLRTRSAIVASSRLLLDISFARGQFEAVVDLDVYKEIVRTYILPQKDLL